MPKKKVTEAFLILALPPPPPASILTGPTDRQIDRQTDDGQLVNRQVVLFCCFLAGGAKS